MRAADGSSHLFSAIIVLNRSSNARFYFYQDHQR